MNKKTYLDCIVNDRGFKDKKPQITNLAPTLRAQDHGNQPKVIERKERIIVDDTYGFEKEIRVYKENSPTLRASRQGLKVLSNIEEKVEKEIEEDSKKIKILDISEFGVRKLTPKEYGRLQGFPVDDGWEQVVSDSQAYKQFGNAVTVTVSKTIAKSIKDFLDTHIA